MTKAELTQRVEDWAEHRDLRLVAINFDLEQIVVAGHNETGTTYTVSYAGLEDYDAA